MVFISDSNSEYVALVWNIITNLRLMLSIALNQLKFVIESIRAHYIMSFLLIYVPWCTICPRSSDPFYIVTYYLKWVTSSWTYSTLCFGQNASKYGRLPRSDKWGWKKYEHCCVCPRSPDSKLLYKLSQDFFSFQHQLR